ncbi:unnamed protein product [Clonostachys chloroleuca]|uniref:DUF6594 domain-containing protein n=1 Tax=Clonostachys chloroleuca TaxID=1926264 RepID=A0AA35PWG3_9HYPO|nr:unnamed protein product [Clonostachys chloroleuca]
MGDIPDVAIFSRFLDLSTESLLHYQAELREIQSHLRIVQEADRDLNSGGMRNTYEFNSSVLRESYLAELDDDSDPDLERVHFDSKRQWETLLKARGTMKEYHEALLLHRQIVNLPKPPQGQVDSLNDWMRRPTRGNMYLKGSDSELWKDSKLNELMTMEQPTSDDTSSSTIRVVKLYHNIIGRFIHDEPDEQHMKNTIVYTNNGAIKVVRGAKTLVACMIPILGIVVLYFVKDQGARLGVIAAFTAIFSVTLSAFTPAAMKDIFSATAAFSAVLVVFVGGTF